MAVTKHTNVISVECNCGPEAPVWRTSDLLCDHKCEVGSHRNCGGWGFMTVYQISSVPVHVPVNDEVTGAYAKGCFEDMKGGQRLGGYSFDSDWMTAEECGRVRKAKHYEVFGVEFGRECFCGDRVPNGDGKADKCDKQCTGNHERICGGHNRIHIFKWGNNYDDSGPNQDVPYHELLQPDAYHGASVLGCFKDSKHNRALDGESKDDKHMSAKVCGDFCLHESYRFFGTQYSTQCFCGNHFNHTGEVDGDDCDYACCGKPSVACGGKNRVNVYKLADNSYAEAKAGVVEPAPDNMLGCFKDTKYRRILNLKTTYKSHDMTPEKCYWHCKVVDGALYYGVEFSEECFCGGRHSRYHDYPLEESSCLMPCPGDKKKYCGGRNAMNVYGPKQTF